MRKWRIRLVLVVALPVLSILGWRGYPHFRPAGATWVPPVLGLTYGSVDGGVLRSANGRPVTVVFHDLGAAHSGNYWTWVVTDHWLAGKRVVAEGYSSPEVRDGRVPFPLRWNADGSFTA